MRLASRLASTSSTSGGARVFAARGKRMCCRPCQSDQFCNQSICQDFRRKELSDLPISCLDFLVCLFRSAILHPLFFFGLPISGLPFSVAPVQTLVFVSHTLVLVFGANSMTITAMTITIDAVHIVIRL